MEILVGLVLAAIAGFAGWGFIERGRRRAAERKTVVEKTRRQEARRAEGIVERREGRGAKLDNELWIIRKERDERLAADDVTGAELDDLDKELDEL